MRPPVVLSSPVGGLTAVLTTALICICFRPRAFAAGVGREAAPTRDPTSYRADVSDRVSGGSDLPKLHSQPLLALGGTSGEGFCLVLGVAEAGGPRPSSYGQAARGRNPCQAGSI